MTESTLRQVMTIFEEANNPLSVSVIARSLDISPEQLEAMLQYWIRKGRIREVVDTKDCGTCGINGSCPFVIELPRSYELVDDDLIVIPIQACGPSCEHKPR